MHVVEKCLARATGKEEVSAGDIIELKVDVGMVHDVAGPRVVKIFEESGFKKVKHSDKIVAIFDHQILPSNDEAAAAQEIFRKFIKKHGIRYYKVGFGISHQLLPEMGYVRPGTIIVGTDSHTITAGAFGAVATGIGSTEMVGLMVAGKIWVEVPKIIKIHINGILPNATMAKDVALYILSKIGSDGALGKAIEFTGSSVNSLSIDGRMVLTNMAVEMGAVFGYIEPDEKTIRYVEGRSRRTFELIKSDPDVKYERTYKFTMEELEPLIACPHTVSNIRSLCEVEGTDIQQGFIGSCTGGRLEDFRAAAKILRGRKIHSDVRLIISPASREVYLKALEEGLIGVFLDSEAILCPPGCGLCGPRLGCLAPGERCISASSRNFRGRMGSPESEIYLASPASVAASALKGEITDPRKLLKR